MALQKHSTRSARKSAISDFLPRVVNSALLICALCNFVVVFWGVSSAHPKTVHSVLSVTTNHWFVVTQVVERVTANTRQPVGGVSPVVERVGAEVGVYYDYMVVDGQPMIYFCGRSYGVGDYVSYGRISAIFPDRVRLEDGLFLKNQKYERGQNVGI